MKEKERCKIIEEIWNKADNAIHVGCERLRIESFTAKKLKQTDLRVIKQFRVACELMELIQIMKEDLKIDSVFEYKKRYRNK